MRAIVVSAAFPGAWRKVAGAKGCRGERRPLSTMGLADKLLRRECDQFCGDGASFSQAEQKLIALAPVLLLAVLLVC